MPIPSLSSLDLANVTGGANAHAALAKAVRAASVIITDVNAPMRALKPASPQVRALLRKQMAW